MADILETYSVKNPEQAIALLNPLRGEILLHLRVPASASEVAREINEPPQRINYHLKALEKVGLVKQVGKRQVKNLVEILYQAVARSFLLAETLGLSPQALQRLKDQSSLSHLIQTTERIKTDALRLMEGSDQNNIIPSATLQSEIILRSEKERQAFVEDYVEMMKKLAKKYQTTQSDGHSYQVVLAVYPQPGKEGNHEKE